MGKVTIAMVFDIPRFCVFENVSLYVYEELKASRTSGDSKIELGKSNLD